MAAEKEKGNVSGTAAELGSESSLEEQERYKKQVTPKKDRTEAAASGSEGREA
jgi:hypothetical protein